MKAWRESKQYKKFMMASNLTALKYKMNTNNNLLKQCFHALRQHKEDTKLSVMTEAFECNLTPENEELSKQIKKTEKQAVQHGRSRACKDIEKTLKIWLRGYFKRWKEATQYKNIGMGKDLKDKIIRRFRQRLQDAFNLWKHGNSNKKITAVEMDF